MRDNERKLASSNLASRYDEGDDGFVALCAGPAHNSCVHDVIVRAQDLFYFRRMNLHPSATYNDFRSASLKVDIIQVV